MAKIDLNNDIDLLKEEQVLGVYRKSKLIHTGHLLLSGFFCIFLIGFPLLFNEIARFAKTKIVITNKRVLDIQGDLFTTKNKSVELSRIDSSEYMQDVTGRLFNFGTVEIFPLDGEHIYRKNIESPLELINTLNAAREASKKNNN